MRDVLVRRFERGVQATHGGAGFVMRGCVVTENNIGIELDAIDGPIEDMVLSETRVDLNSSKGIVLHSSQFHRVSDIQIRKCSLRRGPDLLDIEGARNTICTATTFRGGARPGVQGSENLSVRDVPEDATVTTDGLYFHACSFQNMRQRFEGACENLRYNNCRFDTNFWDLNSPRNSILLLDADESPDDRVESSGTANLVRKNDGLTHIDVPDRTTDATAKAVWSYRLAAGECAYLEVTATGRQLNGTNVAVYRTERGVYLAGATLAFDNGITEFRVGDLVANKTRTGRARITAKTGTAATGTLTISEIQGEFLNDDVIGTPDLNGAIPESATVNGALSYPAACTLFDTDAETAKETDNSWGGLGLVANGQSVDVVVGGKAATTIDWTVNLKLTRI